MLQSSFYQIRFLSSTGDFIILEATDNPKTHELYFSKFLTKPIALRCLKKYQSVPDAAFIEGHWVPFTGLPGNTFSYGEGALYVLEMYTLAPHTHTNKNKNVFARPRYFRFPSGNERTRFVLVNYNKNMAHKRRECAKDEVRYQTS